MASYEALGTFSVGIVDDNELPARACFHVLVKPTATIAQLETVLGDVADNIQLLTDGWPVDAWLSIPIHNPYTVEIDHTFQSDRENVVILKAQQTSELGNLDTVYVPSGRKALFNADGTINTGIDLTGWFNAQVACLTYLTWVNSSGVGVGRHMLRRLTMHRSKRP